MTISRRKMIALIGGGVVVAATAGTMGFLSTRRPDSALAPWGNTEGYDDPRMNALSWAILAPNPHNRQPWVAELTGSNGIRIWRDAERNLPETDPFDRQLTIGMGCFLELLRQSAAQQGLACETALFPGGETGPTAEVTLVPGGTPDPLFAQALARHTNRQAYEDRLPAPDVLHALTQDADAVITDPDTVAELRRLTWEAMEIEMRTPRTHMESVHLMRLGKAEIETNPDGITLGGPKLEALMLAGLITREGLADPEHAQFQQSLNMLRATAQATPAYGVITTPGNTRADQIEAGRRWLRLHLAATGQGLSMQPMSQALQEYPEQAALYAEVHERLAKPGETVQMLGRLGYGPTVGPSPRWPLETRLKHA